LKAEKVTTVEAIGDGKVRVASQGLDDAKADQALEVTGMGKTLGSSGRLSF
jgi:hypothetical protein